jgi:DNA polymerase III alpha subunit
VPVTRLKGLTDKVADRVTAARKDGVFGSLADFFHRVRPSGEELEAMIRAGAFDSFGESRTRQFWCAQYMLRTFGAAAASGQSWLLPPALQTGSLDRGAGIWTIKKMD